MTVTTRLRVPISETANQQAPELLQGRSVATFCTDDRSIRLPCARGEHPMSYHNLSRYFLNICG